MGMPCAIVQLGLSERTKARAVAVAPSSRVKFLCGANWFDAIPTIRSVFSALSTYLSLVSLNGLKPAGRADLAVRFS